MDREYWTEKYDINGFNIFGRDNMGFDRYNRDPEGFNRDGRDRGGYNREGEHPSGEDRDDEDEDGFWLSVDGFRVNDYNIWGYDREGYDRNDRDEEGYDREGYHDWGHNRAGLDRNSDDLEINLMRVYRFDRNGNDIYDNESSDDEREGEILTLNNKSRKLVLDFNTVVGENYVLKQIPDCNADIPLPSGKAWEVHNLFNKEKKIFMSLYYSLGDTNFEPMTVNSVDLFIEIKRLFNAKLYNIVNTLPDYDIKISILIKTLRKLLSKLYEWLVKSRIEWEYESYCDQNRAYFREAICDYTKAPPKPLPVLKI
jgi:hypothetical protein